MLNVPMVSAMTVLALDQEAEGALVAKEQLSLEFPLTQRQVHALRRTLLDASRAPAADLCKFIKCSDIEELLRLLREDLKQEPTLVEVSPSEGVTVTVVGDTHGQFHDVCHMMDMVGDPSPTNFYVFNGDYVDRGAWGLETLLLIGAWRLAKPHAVTMLRGNHETALCSMVYGFKGELVAKLGRGKWKDLYSQCKHVFAALPLAALVASSTLILHGGLFRKRASRQQTARKRSRSPEVGSLADLRAAHKGGLDPSGRGAYRLATDVLWSDPVPEPGFALNASRGVGTVFGPDVTDAFLRANGLRLVLRSHEGPDAREGRDDVLPMSRGYAEDHVGASGMLATVFSAPDYPQFQVPGVPRHANRAAVAQLEAPGWDRPRWAQFDAVLPRPHATPYYDLRVPDSDEELEPVSPERSGMTDVRAEREGAEGEEGEEAQSAPSPDGKLPRVE